MGDPRREPLPLLSVKAEVEYSDREFSAMRPNRQNRVAEQRKIAAIRPADDQQPTVGTGSCREVQGTRR
jgi:hypothetical protein